jgi:hypothetical protein
MTELEKYKLKLEQEIQESQNRADLREIANFYGGWDELRAVIKELEDNDNEAAFERFYGNSDNHVSAGERAEQLHKMQQLK